jgi:hypothetical protein
MPIVDGGTNEVPLPKVSLLSGRIGGWGGNIDGSSKEPCKRRGCIIVRGYKFQGYEFQLRCFVKLRLTSEDKRKTIFSNQAVPLVNQNESFERVQKRL